MQYLGGKQRQARTIVEHIARLTTNRTLIEPFCGACNVTAEAARQGFTVRASDAHPALIAMWQAFLAGWRPESDTLTEEQYAAAKGLPDTDPLKALAGFGASFGAKYFGGYARGIIANYFATAIRSCDRKARLMGDRVTVDCLSYDQLVIQPDDVVYCDPPYRATTRYSTSVFDSDAFWTWVRATSVIAPVFVTEFDVPADAQLIAVFDRPAKLDNVNNGPQARIEKLVAFGLERT